MKSIVYLLAVLLLAAGPARSDEIDRDLLQSFARPDYIPFPEGAPYDREIATLGKMLFFDPRLSGAQNMSCASCHNPSFGWETPVDLAIGAQNHPLGRHAPTVVNAAWVTPLFWDGRAHTLEDQAAGPITADVEMNATFPQIISRLNSVPEYRAHFRRLFPEDGMTRDTILQSIATYERTIVSGLSPFDRWVGGDETAISDQAKEGYQLFVGRGRCADCHNGWNFSNNGFFDTGLDDADIGRGAVSPDEPEMHHRFKTPGLRNISLRAPYMHNGSLPTLDSVVRFYVFGGLTDTSREPDITAFAATEEDITALVRFLESLTEDKTDVPTPILPAN